jgi:predicted nucleotidyltransferase
MNFIEFIKNKPEVRKIFGERELKIIEKQLLGVKLTQSEKNRLSRDIRKKLEVIRELAKYEKEFELKKGSKNKEMVEEVIKIVKQTELFPKIKRIILFGSVAEKEQTLMSDIDIAIDFDKIDALTAFKFRSKIAGQFSKEVDIQIYNLLPENIKKQIDEKGKILYQR